MRDAVALLLFFVGCLSGTVYAVDFAPVATRVAQYRSAFIAFHSIGTLRQTWSSSLQPYPHSYFERYEEYANRGCYDIDTHGWDTNDEKAEPNDPKSLDMHLLW